MKVLIIIFAIRLTGCVIAQPNPEHFQHFLETTFQVVKSAFQAVAPGPERVQVSGTYENRFKTSEDKDINQLITERAGPFVLIAGSSGATRCS